MKCHRLGLTEAGSNRRRRPHSPWVYVVRKPRSLDPPKSFVT